MRRAVSFERVSDIVSLKAKTEDSEKDKGHRNLEVIHRGETWMTAAGRRRRHGRLPTTT